MSQPVAFWDSSALVSLCVPQIHTARAVSLYRRFSVVAWWATEVEILSGLSRLRRMGQISPARFTEGKKLAAGIVRDWVTVNITANVVPEACSLLELYPLRAADALQLAAAIEASEHHPTGYVFVTGDERQAEAARLIGFSVEFV